MSRRQETTSCANEKWPRQLLPNLLFRILSIRRIISELSKPTSSINNEDRIPIENRRSYVAPAAHFKRFYQKGSGPPAPKSPNLYCRSPSDRILPFFRGITRFLVSPLSRKLLLEARPPANGVLGRNGPFRTRQRVIAWSFRWISPKDLVEPEE